MPLRRSTAKKARRTPPRTVAIVLSRMGCCLIFPTIMGGVATFVTFNRIRPAGSPAGAFVRMAHAARRLPVEGLATIDRTPPRARKTQRPLATWAVAKGRTLMRSGCLPSPLLLLPGSCGRFTDIRCTIVLFARTGQAKSRHRTVISRSHEPPSAARIRSIICIISSVSGQRGSMASARGKGKRRWSRGLRGNARPAGLGPVRLTSPSSSTGWGGLGRRHDRQCYLPQLLEPSKGH